MNLFQVSLRAHIDPNGRFHKASLRLVQQNYWCKHDFSVKLYEQKEFRPNTGLNRPVYRPKVKPAQGVV